MNRWKRGSLWIGAGLALGAVMLTFSITGVGIEDDPEGSALALLVTVFYLGFSAAAFLVVRGLLIFMEGFSTRSALKLGAAALGAIISAIVLHNVLFALTGTEEPFFFLFALFVGPAILLAAIIRAFRPSRSHTAPTA